MAPFSSHGGSRGKSGPGESGFSSRISGPDAFIAGLNGLSSKLAESPAVPVQVVDDLDAITARLRHMDDQLGGGPLLRLIHEHLRYVTTLLSQGRYDDTTGRRLHATAAELLRPEVDPALSYARQALDTLSDQVDSARCRNHLTRFAEQLAPYRRNNNVRAFLDQVKEANGASSRRQT